MLQIDKPHANFQSLLQKKGLKFTYERKSIYQEVMRFKHHFNADSLYERFKHKGTNF